MGGRRCPRMWDAGREGRRCCIRPRALRPAHTAALLRPLPADSRRCWGAGRESGAGGTHPSPSQGRRIVVQPGSTHLHSKSSPRSIAGPWDCGWRGQTCPVLSASSAEQMFRRAWLPETSAASPVARACKESQHQSTAKRPSSSGNQIWPQRSASTDAGSTVAFGDKRVTSGAAGSCARCLP